MDGATDLKLILGGLPSVYAGNQWGGYHNSAMDDVRVYNRALSASEVEALYHENGWPVQ